MFAIEMLDGDELYKGLIAAEISRGIDLVLIIEPETMDLVHDVWTPAFERARRGGEITSPLTNYRLIQGHVSLSAMLTLRSDMDSESKRQFMTDFFLPVLIA